MGIYNDLQKKNLISFVSKNFLKNSNRKIFLLKNGINTFRIPESFNINISHQFFDYKITFVNSHRDNTNLNGDFVLKNRVETGI